MRKIRRVFRMAPQLIVTMIADCIEIILGVQPSRHFTHEIIHLAIFLPIDHSTDGIFVRYFVCADDVQHDHINRWIVEPPPRFAIDKCVSFQEGNMQVFVI